MPRPEMKFLVVYAEGSPAAPVNGRTEAVDGDAGMLLYRARHLLMRRLREGSEFFEGLPDHVRVEFYERFRDATIGELLDGVLVRFETTAPRFCGIIPVGTLTSQAGQVRGARRAAEPVVGTIAEQIARRAAAAGRKAVA